MGDGGRRPDVTKPRAPACPPSAAEAEARGPASLSLPHRNVHDAGKSPPQPISPYAHGAGGEVLPGVAARAPPGPPDPHLQRIPARRDTRPARRPREKARGPDPGSAGPRCAPSDARLPGRRSGERARADPVAQLQGS